MKMQIGGDLQSAEDIYVEILSKEPDNPDGNHLLGLIRSEQDKNDDAVDINR